MALDFENGRVDLVHGSGGRASQALIESLFYAEFKNDLLAQSHDATLFKVDAGRMVMSTDGHVISPLFFPGGNIGSLAVHGTVNDVSMSGARPLYLSASFILEEGLALSQLRRIVQSMASAAREANVKIICGDTKVVEKGKGDGVFISTTGVGVVDEGIDISPRRVTKGDVIILNGDIGDHGVAIMSQRENLSFETEIVSDSSALNDLVATMLKVAPDIHCLRDPTRGGLGATLNEICQQAGVGIQLDETSIPLKPQVAAACELLGLDPLYVANEGKLLCFCSPENTAALLAAMRQHPQGRRAAVIGEVVEDAYQLVQMKTSMGGQRVVDWLHGDQLPRIC